MQDEILVKYTIFLRERIDEMIRSNNLDDDSMTMFINELKNFNHKVQQYDYPASVCNLVSEIEGLLSENKLRRSSRLRLAYLITFGAWYFIYNYRTQQKRKELLLLINDRLAELNMSIYLRK